MRYTVHAAGREVNEIHCPCCRTRSGQRTTTLPHHPLPLLHCGGSFTCVSTRECRGPRESAGKQTSNLSHRQQHPSGPRAHSVSTFICIYTEGMKWKYKQRVAIAGIAPRPPFLMGLGSVSGHKAAAFLSPLYTPPL